MNLYDGKVFVVISGKPVLLSELKKEITLFSKSKVKKYYIDPIKKLWEFLMEDLNNNNEDG